LGKVRLYESLDDVPAGFGPSAVAIGKFDGMHAGHQRVLAELREQADRAGLVAVAVTFDRHPLSLLDPSACPDPLISNAQKVELIEDTGVDVTLMLAFDKPFSEQSPREFVERMLLHALDTKVVMVGADFRFGSRGGGTVNTLREFGTEFGFEVQLVPDVVPGADGALVAARRASSTWIRELLSHGRVAESRVLLGRRPTVRGVVVDGEKRGKTLGYPTANLGSDIEGYLPADGVYAARITIDHEPFDAAVSIGNNPTFSGERARRLEAHVLDQSLELYGKTVEIEFVEYVRPMEKFDDADALVQQMHLDEKRIREILKRETPNDG
jgi:riboflavin kinase / FMN adenylyltransferase